MPIYHIMAKRGQAAHLCGTYGCRGALAGSLQRDVHLGTANMHALPGGT